MWNADASRDSELLEAEGGGSAQAGPVVEAGDTWASALISLIHRKGGNMKAWFLLRTFAVTGPSARNILCLSLQHLFVIWLPPA